MCCFCHKELTTKESLAVGYGPLCAEKLGLPWGETAERVYDRRDLAETEAADGWEADEIERREATFVAPRRVVCRNELTA